LFGPVVGAVILVAVEEYSRVIFGSTGAGTDMIVYAVLIIQVAVYSPTGVLGLARDLKRRFLPATRPAEVRP
ncbi:hypothetical protein WH510_24255, partial [Salmonella enterica subsp. enterica]|uniref:hypothetical protein n=1 Tax=Salmonella enterica TaxID=28901 RepID=UPI0030ACED91